MNGIVTLTGMILIASPLKEYDKRVEILTRERGRISVFAQGARKPNSTLSACTIPFTFGEFQVYEGRNSYTLKSGAISNYFGNLADDYDCLCYASYFTDIVRYISRENVEADNEIILLYITFRALQARKVKTKLIRRIFEMRILTIQGEGIEMFECLRCNSKDAYDVYFKEGGLICADCAAKDKNLREAVHIRLSGDARYTLQYILASSPQKLYSFNVSNSVMAEIDGFMKKYMARYMPHHFKTAEFLQQES